MTLGDLQRRLSPTIAGLPELTLWHALFLIEAEDRQRKANGGTTITELEKQLNEDRKGLDVMLQRGQLTEDQHADAVARWEVKRDTLLAQDDQHEPGDS